ncbi:MAG TPA: sigma-54 dependent transcriptional regulator [Vicinamibacterales bacterium]|jgi:DNA-binding NtrC family response regulator
MTSQHPILLLVDDDERILDVVARFARRAGFDVITCAGGKQAIDELRRQPADLAMVDLRMPDVNGLDVLRAIRETVPGCAVILMTGYAGIDSAVEAIKLGAVDYLTKPFDFERLAHVLETVRDEAERRRGLLAAEGEVARRLEFCEMIGRSAIMQEIFSLIRRLAPHVRTALVTGETGTGKELAARALHRMGPRRDRRFVAVNCSAVVETLFESELFGHVRGAFTGATDTKQGLFELADGGTLFLDEIGELPLTVQAKLLRVLETGEVQRVGSLETRRIDAHVFASTNRDLRAEVAGNRFRSDLFYRLNVVELRLPPLRRRPEDIPYLTAAFVRECSGRLHKPLVGLSAAAERLLASAPWEGNVRELRNVVERACILAEGDLITEKDLAVNVPAAGDPPVALAPPTFAEALVQVSAAERVPADDDQESLASIERDHIMRTLRRVGGNKKAAAKMLGLSRRALYRRLERHQLDETITRRKGHDMVTAE